ncbi:protein phosphatase 1E-like [Mya arenaria]|uniref:protein phosphatase 1E-like n=1 Tax=Mya arenaria TaxID=6604 RepID=UPI0022E39F6D|nr:protein phosphatase 1E-like [Mya arenaria]
MDKTENSNKSKEFHNFLTELCNQFKEKCDTENSVPLRHPNPRVTTGELEGECLVWCLEHLSTRGCPAGFSYLLARDVYRHIEVEDLAGYVTEDKWRDPSPPGNDAQTNGDNANPTSNDEDIEYDAKSLHDHVLDVLGLVCKAWLDNFPVFNIAGKEPVVSHHAIKNTRRKMEDKHVIVQDLNALYDIKDQTPQAFYGIFDGHAGSDASMFAAKHILTHLVRHCNLATDPARACTEAFRLTDEQFITKARKEKWRSGCTGVVSLLRGSRLYMAWLGDSQAVLVNNGKAANYMEPHKPDNLAERERIQKEGGFVMKVGEMWRVGGNLAVSRAIGDVQYKPFVSSKAEVQEMSLDGGEEYLVLACDGLWDGLTPEELPHVVYNYVTKTGGDLQGVAKHLVKYAKDNDSQDNISVIVVFFRENLSKPVADTGLFNLLGGSDTQGSNDLGKGKGDFGGSSGAGKGGDTDNTGANSPGHNGPNGATEVPPADENMNNEEINNESEKTSDLNEMNIDDNEHLFNMNHSFMMPFEAEKEELSENLDEEVSGVDDADCYGVFNTRMVDGPLDLDFISDTNSTGLLKDIANTMYNQSSFDQFQHVKDESSRINGMQVQQSRNLNKSLQSYLNAERVGDMPKVKREEHTRVRRNGKKKSGSPVCWAFTGKNKASVQNHKLNMAAKSFNKVSGEAIPSVKLPPFKFAQNYSRNENIHDIANLTMSNGKLESIPQPWPKVLPSSLDKLSGFTVFGNKSARQNESQKFQTMWRPRKPLKPITTVVYETPPTPFVNTKLGLTREH